MCIFFNALFRLKHIYHFYKNYFEFSVLLKIRVWLNIKTYILSYPSYDVHPHTLNSVHSPGVNEFYIASEMSFSLKCNTEYCNRSICPNPFTLQKSVKWCWVILSFCCWTSALLLICCVQPASGVLHWDC